ncbi:MAG: hypothetical protein K8L99_11890 [Anaerolineae bacterium]|nr:hypothetical protein [Anaerolineae bacterium]
MSTSDPQHPWPNRNQPESESDDSDIVLIWRWRCPNCGQTAFTFDPRTPPDMCDYCGDMTTWKRVEDNE